MSSQDDDDRAGDERDDGADATHLVDAAVLHVEDQCLAGGEHVDRDGEADDSSEHVRVHGLEAGLAVEPRGGQDGLFGDERLVGDDGAHALDGRCELFRDGGHGTPL